MQGLRFRTAIHHALAISITAFFMVVITLIIGGLFVFTARMVGRHICRGMVLLTVSMLSHFMRHHLVIRHWYGHSHGKARHRGYHECQQNHNMHQTFQHVLSYTLFLLIGHK